MVTSFTAEAVVPVFKTARPFVSLICAIFGVVSVLFVRVSVVALPTRVSDASGKLMVLVVLTD